MYGIFTYIHHKFKWHLGKICHTITFWHVMNSVLLLFAEWLVMSHAALQLGGLVQKSGWKQHVTWGQPTSCQKSKEGMIVVSIVLLGCVCLVFFLSVWRFSGKHLCWKATFFHLQDDINWRQVVLGKCGKTRWKLIIHLRYHGHESMVSTGTSSDIARCHVTVSKGRGDGKRGTSCRDFCQ